MPPLTIHMLNAFSMPHMLPGAEESHMSQPWSLPWRAMIPWCWHHYPECMEEVPKHRDEMAEEILGTCKAVLDGYMGFDQLTRRGGN